MLFEEDTILLMDNCSRHLTRVVIELLSAARLRIVTFAAHTTQTFQVLDLALSGVLKRRDQYQLPLGDDIANRPVIIVSVLSWSPHFLSGYSSDFATSIFRGEIIPRSRNASGCHFVFCFTNTCGTLASLQILVLTRIWVDWSDSQITYPVSAVRICLE
jgi:hypothetical protein